MANGVKISDLPTASSIHDDALVVLVQDNTNRVVSVEQLADKINDKQNQVIANLYHELKHVTGGDYRNSIKNTLANHEYRIDGIERKNGDQDNQLVLLTKALQDDVARVASHSNDIHLLKNATVENRKSIAYLSGRVDTLSEKVAYIDTVAADLEEFKKSEASDILNLADILEKRAQQVEKELDDSYTYLCSYIHFTGDMYWKSIEDVHGLNNDL
jgi:chromosome segregation ATPase